jgi:hypothetical protein
MSESRTLQFESARSVQELYANDLKLLKTLRKRSASALPPARAG